MNINDSNFEMLHLLYMAITAIIASFTLAGLLSSFVYPKKPPLWGQVPRPLLRVIVVLSLSCQAVFWLTYYDYYRHPHHETIEYFMENHFNFFVTPLVILIILVLIALGYDVKHRFSRKLSTTS